MKLKTRSLIFLYLAFTMTACNLPTEPINESGFDKNGILTAAAQTVEAILTEEFVRPLTETPVPTFEIPSQNSTDTPEPNTQITATDEPLEVTVENEVVCNLATFISDVTVSDGTDFNSGEVFVKTWRLKNNGTCTWTSGYEIVFFDGYSMGGPASQQLTSSTVAPGEELNISIELTAPVSEGSYKGFWKLRSPDGIVFALNANTAFWVEIDVVP